jgi:hypothetical protein
MAFEAKGDMLHLSVGIPYAGDVCEVGLAMAQVNLSVQYLQLQRTGDSMSDVGYFNI